MVLLLYTEHIVAIQKVWKNQNIKKIQRIKVLIKIKKIMSKINQANNSSIFPKSHLFKHLLLVLYYSRYYDYFLLLFILAIYTHVFLSNLCSIFMNRIVLISVLRDWFFRITITITITTEKSNHARSRSRVIVIVIVTVILMITQYTSTNTLFWNLLTS